MVVTQQTLLDTFQYNPSDGTLVWKVTLSNRRRKGQVAGNNAHGYRQASLYGQLIYTHRIVWTMHYGEIPKGMVIDHIDRNPTNNRLENLRVVPQALNCRNSKLCRRNKTGIKGVHWSKKDHQWVAQGRVGRKTKHLGMFKDKEKAIEVRRAYEKEHGFISELQL